MPVYLRMTTIHGNCKQILALSCSRVIAVKGFILAFLPKNIRRDSTKARIYVSLGNRKKRGI